MGHLRCYDETRWPKMYRKCRVCPGRLSLPRQDRQRNAALLAFSVFSELKHVFLVDEDVDIFDMSDVMWAMTTRFQADVDMISIPGCRCHVLDPSNDHALAPSIRVHGIACKAIFDCTVPFDQKENFVRSNFMEIDKDKWAKESRSKKDNEEETDMPVGVIVDAARCCNWRYRRSRCRKKTEKRLY